MKKRINKLFGLITIIFALLIVASCNDKFLDQEIPHIIAPDNLYVDEAGFNAGLNGLYALVRIERAGSPNESNPRGTGNGITCSLMMAGTDVLYSNRVLGSTRFFNEWGENVLGSSTQDFITEVWNWLYNVVNTSNTIINRAEGYNAGDIDEDKLNRIVAEARTIRAWAYRHLTFLFGDVPLVVEESTGENVRLDWERTPLTDIREQMKEDLEFGAMYLPENHINDGKIVRAVAQHYLTELLIIEGDFTGAITVALAAVNGPKQLITSRYGVNASNPGTVFSDMFLDGNSNPSEGNTEALWVFQNDYTIESVSNEAGGNNIMRRWFNSDFSASGQNGLGLNVTVERGGRGLGRISATKFQTDLYRNGSGNLIDERGDEFAWRTYFVVEEYDNPVGSYDVGDTIWLDFNKVERVNDNSRPFARKWDWSIEADPLINRSYNDQVYLRLADTYLLLAEAYYKNGENGNAAIYINALRDRANAPRITAGDVTLDFILDERARELYLEEHRRYTLLRNDKWIERTNAHNALASGNLTDRDKLYPIPQSFIDANLDRKIDNNPGY